MLYMPVILLMCMSSAGAVTCSYLFQQVDELISGQPLEDGEVGELRGVSPGTVSHAGHTTDTGQHSGIHDWHKQRK